MPNAENVSFGKPKANGALYRAPLGTTLPTDATTTLSGAFICLGYSSEDGLTNSNTATTQQVKAWGGDVVATTQTEKPDNFKFKLIEVMDVNVLKTVYHPDNVSGTLATGITVRANSKEQEPYVWVADIALTNNGMKRIVIPNGKIESVGDIVYKDNEITGYDISLLAMPGSDGDTHKEYIIRVTGATGST